MEESEWARASDSCDIAGNDERAIRALYLAGDVSGLQRTMLKLAPTSQLLPVVGRMFVSIGDINNAVAAFKTCGDIAAAVDACARLNHWKPALALAGKGRTQEIRARMARYANELIDNGLGDRLLCPRWIGNRGSEAAPPRGE
jgi:WD repeat-containing protein 35